MIFKNVDNQTLITYRPPVVTYHANKVIRLNHLPMRKDKWRRVNPQKERIQMY